MSESPPNHQSLYRRFRPKRFSEVLGQDHVTKALRNAVRDGRVGHAYLFSGPRGTGKTSAARILAKVLNCANPQDGEPCCECDNCLAVQRGQVTDWFLEQDAASKSKVDDMRDLLDRVPLGTSGNRKVIILDEVHMLSQGAENALLKTLEEPPDHVIFVLATTDPQKVRPTIRSRTQHFSFNLLPPDILDPHIRHVIGEAGLDLGDDAVTHVLRAGAGSARDALSALDQVAALGEVVADSAPVDAILDALAAKDAGAILVAVAQATATGREPRTLGENIIARLRDAFLAVLGVGDEQLPAEDRARAKALGEAIGTAGLTRAMEVLGEALMELSRKPDPRVVVEVALIRLTRPDADRSIDAILERLASLEEAVRSGGGSGPVAPPQPAAPTTDAPAARSAPAPTASPPPSPGSNPASAARAALAETRKGKANRSNPGAAADPSATATPATADGPTDQAGGAASTADTNRPTTPGGSPTTSASQPDGTAATGGTATATSGTATAAASQPPGTATATDGPKAASSSPTTSASQSDATATTTADTNKPTAPGSPPSASASQPAGTAATGGTTAASGGQPGGTAATGGTAAASGGQPGGTAKAAPGTDRPTASGGTASASQPSGTATTTAGTGRPAAAGGTATAPAGQPSGTAAATARSGRPTASGSAATTSAGQAGGTATEPVGSTGADGAGAPAGPGGPSQAGGDEGAGVDLAGVAKVWSEVLGELPLPVRSKWRGGNWVTPLTNPAQFAVPNAWHKQACDEGRRDVEQALAGRLGAGITVTVVVDGETAEPPRSGGAPTPATAAPPSDDLDEPVDISELRDANDATTGGVDLLIREFGGELLEEDP